jgi:hypothetical protein
MALLITISFLLIAGRSNARFLMKNNLFIAPDNLSVFDPKLNSVVDDESSLDTAGGHMEKDAVECQEILSPRSGSSAKSATTRSRYRSGCPSVQNTDENGIVCIEQSRGRKFHGDGTAALHIE